ncbi:MAG: ribose-phosphate pyrophosphokinase, partial [Muribaculaceae bacterium]|nr:ribose-phosphate pyrophosphokinase [Muribaculaceae bacterium]
ESPLTEMIFTNSIPYRKHCDKCTIISVAKLFADTIRRVHDNESISSQYLIK